MAKYQNYAVYKNTGMALIPEIPECWEIKSLKWFLLNNDGGVWGNEPNEKNDTIVLRSTEQTVDGFWKINDPAKRHLSVIERESALLLDGDLLLTKSSGSALHIGKTTLVNKDIELLKCCYSNFMQRIRVNDCIIPRYVWYLLNNGIVRKQFEFLSNTTTGLSNLNSEIIGEIKIPICSLGEQSSILSFLDHEIAKIDHLIQKQQQLIELLKEKRQAVISHAVTKGLDPNVSMKDSGVEWLGEVPEHWETLPLKLCVETRKGVAFKAVDFCDSGIRVVKASDIKQKTIRESEVFLPDCYINEYPKAVLYTGDLVLSTVGSTPEVKNSAVGQIGKVPESLNGSLLNQNTVVFSANKLLDQGFLFYLVQTNSYRDHLDLNAHGTANQASLNISDMLDFIIPMPETNEQIQITHYLDNKIAKLEELEAKSASMISNLTERRTALISAAVTGKIDVRHWQAPTITEADTELSA